MRYVHVIIDNKSERVDKNYVYACEYDDVSAGNRVIVPFADGNRERLAYITKVSDAPESELKNIKSVISVDEEFSLNAKAIEICKWMRRRYLCKYIDAIKCFLPAGQPSKRGKKRKPAFPEIPEDMAATLTAEQNNALEFILPRIEKKRYSVVLIHGVTGSGKTEVYLRSAEMTIKTGRKVIILVPEISLTPQTIGRFIARFGVEKVAILHSKLSNGERYDEWIRIMSGDPDIAIGARSAVFAPFDDIGLIVIDEEHESSYKSDKAPKYDTIEVAVKRARQNGAVVLLGSATPSLVSNYRVEKGYFDRVYLKERYNKNALPEVRVVDMREELRNGNKTILSLCMYNSINETLKSGRQVILFLNRRGHSTFISCRGCGYAMQCPDCGISLTYHKEGDSAVCHFCGFKQAVPNTCPECGSAYIKLFGVGTEKVEETARVLFPSAVIERLDADTAQKKGSVSRILAEFRKGKTDILIGTQLVAKGLDFSNVGFVGIVSADVTLNVPDFRAAERTFQLIIQASGRAGRGDVRGKVVIQSYKPDHYAINSAATHDYERFCSTETLIRKAMEYPPFSDLALITVDSKKPEIAGAYADFLATALRKRNAAYDRHLVLGPRQAFIFRSGEYYRYQVLVKVRPEDRVDFEAYMRAMKDALLSEKKAECSFVIDVNPASFLS